MCCDKAWRSRDRRRFKNLIVEAVLIAFDRISDLLPKVEVIDVGGDWRCSLTCLEG
jgi:hypothetical protein